MNSFKLKIIEKFQNKNIKQLLEDFHFSKSKIYLLNNDKSFFVNKKSVDKNYVLNLNDLLEIELKEKIDIQPVESNLEIAYEDDYYLVVNKPRDILVHDDGNKQITLNNLVAGYYKSHHIRRKIRSCNRLDYGTSGLIIYAKDPISEAIMNYMILQRQIEKKYYALCENRFSKKEGLIDLPIARNRHDSQKMIINKNGKEAKTYFKVLVNGPVSLVDVTLLTGRTHQIRVHLSYINHPLIGDKLYGNGQKGPLFLQSYSLRFCSPFTNKEILITISMDSLFKEYMEVWNDRRT